MLHLSVFQGGCGISDLTSFSILLAPLACSLFAVSFACPPSPVTPGTAALPWGLPQRHITLSWPVGPLFTGECMTFFTDTSLKSCHGCPVPSRENEGRDTAGQHKREGGRLLSLLGCAPHLESLAHTNAHHCQLTNFVASTAHPMWCSQTTKHHGLNLAPLLSATRKKRSQQ